MGGPTARPQTPLRRSAVRPIRTFVSLLLVFLGLAVVLAAVLADPETAMATRVIMALTGLLLVEAASGKRSNPFLPSTRRHDEFREEVTDFLALARRLNQAGLGVRRSGSADDRATLRGTGDAMHASVDRMLGLAGRVRPGASTLAAARLAAGPTNEPLLGLSRTPRSERASQPQVPLGTARLVQTDGHARADREGDGEEGQELADHFPSQ